MRLSYVALVGLLSLALLGCSSEQTAVEAQQVISEVEVVEVDSSEVDDAAVDTAATEAEAVESDAESDDPEMDDTAVEAADTAATNSEVAEVAAAGDGLFPTVVGATASTGNGTSWQVDVTLSSEYDTPERYADAWRVLDADDNELGIRVLTHDHANEQPFTRSTSVDIPADIDVVFIEGRDQANGWSGERFELALTR